MTENTTASGAAYDLIDRYLRNNLDDTDYAEYNAALESVRAAFAPVAPTPPDWRAQFDEWWARNRVKAHQVKNIGGFSAKVWHAAIQTVVGATDSTAGFYPADEGSIPSRQANFAAPPTAQEERVPLSDAEALAIVRSVPALVTAEEEWLWAIREVEKYHDITAAQKAAP